MTSPASGYILCTSPRSGSTLTCDLLSGTGVTGRPNSFFRPASMADFSASWGIPTAQIDTFDRHYLGTSIARGTDGTGCFGLRIMWDNMPALVRSLRRQVPQPASDRAVLETAFGPLAFIHLARRDQTARAVSLALAEQSGLWHANPDGTTRERSHAHQNPVYDPDQIKRAYLDGQSDLVGWANWFKAQDITPHKLTYEDLSDAPDDTLAGILRFLGHSAPQTNPARIDPANLPPPLNEAWATRFRTDHPAFFGA